MVVAPTEATNVAVVGTVQPQFKTDFGFRMLGRLIARPVNVGETVAKGQALAAVDPFAAELAVRSALAELSTAQGQLANASGIAERQRTLIETGATTKATLDSAEQSNAAAQSAVVRAQSNLTKAREQLGYTKISADYAGVVTAIGAEVGQVVAAGQTVVTVARPDIREAVIDVADDLASALRIGMPLAVTLQLDPRIRAEGKVREIAPQSDAVDAQPPRPHHARRAAGDLPARHDHHGPDSRRGCPRVPAAGDGDPHPATASRASGWSTPPRKSVTSRDVQVAAHGDGSVDVTEGIEAGARIVDGRCPPSQGRPEGPTGTGSGR